MTLQQFLDGELGRTRHPVPLTVAGELGLVEAEALWLSRRAMVFWCPERLLPGMEAEARLDPGRLGRPLDLRLDVREVSDRRVAGKPGGYLHAARLRLVGSDAGERLERLLIREGLAASEPREKATPSSVSRERRGVGKDRRSPVTRRDRPESVPPRRAGRAPPRGARRREGTAGAPRGPAVSSGRSPVVAADGEPLPAWWSAGPPPSCLLRLEHRERARAATRLSGGRLRVAVRPEGETPREGPALLVVALEGGLVLQVEGRVERLASGGWRLCSDLLSPADRAVLERLLG